MSSTTIYCLYVKTHNKTGLKYLGQTTRNPFTYSGSGVEWCNHITIHGKDIHTAVIATSTTKSDINALGRHFSKLWNVVSDPAWANRIPETGGGKGRTYHSPEERARTSLRQSGKNNVACRPEFKEKHSGEKHWMNRPEHSDYVHIMTRPEVKAKVSGTNSVRYDHTKYSFTNRVTNETVSMTKSEFLIYSNLEQSGISRLISKRYSHCGDWILT